MSWLQTREASTLAILGFAVSAGLLLLEVAFDSNGKDDDRLKLSDIAPIGFFFGFIPLLFRQITVWTVDRIQHNREFRINYESRLWRIRRDVYYVYAGIREFLLIWFVSIPIVLWGLAWRYNLEQINGLLIEQAIGGSVFVGLILTGIDLGFRNVDRKHTLES